MKRIFLVACSFAVFTAVNAQSFFKPLPKPNKASMADVATPTLTSAVRPVTNIVAYQEPGHKLMAGAGVAYEWFKWDEVKQRYDVTVSVAAMVWAGGAPTGENQNALVSYGIQVGLFNNLIMVGPTIGQIDGKYKIGAAVGIGINLN